jgi:hypothetical protein
LFVQAIISIGGFPIQEPTLIRMFLARMSEADTQAEQIIQDQVFRRRLTIQRPDGKVVEENSKQVNLFYR